MAGLDTGDMLYRKEVVIERKDTFETLHDKLMAAGGEAITEALPLLEAGKLIPEKQKDEESCYASLITKEMGRMDFKKDAYTLELLVRGMNPWPSAFTTYKGKQLKIWEAWAENQTEGLEKEKQPDSREEEKQPGKAQTTKQPSPGTILSVAKDHFSVATGKGTLAIYSLQLEGKKQHEHPRFPAGRALTAGGEVWGVALRKGSKDYVWWLLWRIWYDVGSYLYSGADRHASLHGSQRTGEQHYEKVQQDQKQQRTDRSRGSKKDTGQRRAVQCADRMPEWQSGRPLRSQDQYGAAFL